MTSMTTSPLDSGPRRADAEWWHWYDETRERLVIEQFYELLFVQDHEGLIDLVCDDVSVHMPWRVPGLCEHADGLDEVRSGLSEIAELWHAGTVTSINIHPLGTPHGWLAEVEGDLTARESGRPYHADYLGRFRFQGGKVAELKHHHNLLEQVIALGADIPGINAPGRGLARVDP